MNTYSSNARDIGILYLKKYPIRKIGELLGYDIETNRDYQRLFKAASRYKKEFLDGKWGIY